MHIDYYKSNGIEYAYVCNTIRNGNKVRKERLRYLGRVIDKEKFVFKNKDSGIYIYDIETDTTKSLPPTCPTPVIQRKNAPIKRKTLGFSFGDVYLVSEFVKRCGLLPAIDAIAYPNMDSLYALIMYYVTQNRANCNATNWYNLSYAKFMYPEANLESQRISEILKDVGSEEAKRDFFSKYIEFLGGDAVKNPRKLKMVVDDGVLIDSTGLPNVARLPCTAVSNHNGKVSEEVRLIYVVQQHTGFPIFYRYVTGNVIDSSTLRKTIREVKKYNVNIKWALVDAGYYTGPNADVLYDEKISFVTRVGGHHSIYKNAVKEHLRTLRNPENMIVYENRLYYIINVDCMIGEKKDHKAYGYLCLDENMWHVEQRTYLTKSDLNGEVDEKVRSDLAEKGLFMLVATRKLKREDILPLYYTRDQVEKVFEITKQYANGIPLYCQTEDTFKGHLLLTFIATIILKLLSNALYKTGFSAMDTLITVHDFQCLLYDDEVLTNDAQKEIADPFRYLKIKIPDSLPIPRPDSGF